jgi:hypothetical protein
LPLEAEAEAAIIQTETVVDLAEAPGELVRPMETLELAEMLHLDKVPLEAIQQM